MKIYAENYAKKMEPKQIVNVSINGTYPYKTVDC